MESSKTHHVKYDGRDAVATLISVCSRGKLTEAEVWGKLEKIELTPQDRKHLQRLTRDLGIAMAILPAATRRGVMVRVGEKILEENAKRAQRRALQSRYPALRESKMLTIARFFYDERTIETIFVPIVSDYIIEYRSARARSAWHAMIAKVRHWYGFAGALGLEKVFSWAERIAKLAWWVWQTFHNR